MSVIYIDGKAHEVKPEQNLLEACLSLGLDLPYFCWHPAMGSVGACRQCAIKQFQDDHDTTGQLVMACMTPATSGTRISIQDPEAQAFRAEIIEWLMLNHPHDCPVCDEGGECHLQDMTVMTGHTARRYRGPKRTYVNQDLGPFLKHEMNRCIQCYRCVRFYRDYAGGKDLNVFGSRDQLYFGRFEDGVLENEFSGNLVEVCPTGVFTDRPLSRHYTRKWDLQTAPSICVHCGVGCNTVIGEREGHLRRVLNRYHHDVNGYFLCDRGRFGYDIVNSEKRIRTVLTRSTRTGQLQPVDTQTALQAVSSCLNPSRRVIGIGSPRASLEANFALRHLVGEEHFYSGLSSRESRVLTTIMTIMRKGAIPTRTLQEVEQADAILVLGEDLVHTAPRLALAVRQSLRVPAFHKADSLGIPAWHDSAVRNATPQIRGPLFLLQWAQGGLDEVASARVVAAPDDLARLGFAIAHELDSSSPAVEGLSRSHETCVKQIADALRNARSPLVISGTSALNESLIEAAANIALGLQQQAGNHPGLCFVAPECNSLGVSLMSERNLEEAFQDVKDQSIETAVILENDVFHRAETQEVTDFLESVPHVVVVDHSHHETTEHADYVFPAGTFAETTGTVVNYEGRAQQLYTAMVPADPIQDSWRWIQHMARVGGYTGDFEEWSTKDDVTERLATTLVPFHALQHPSLFEHSHTDQLIPRQLHRFSGRTALSAHRTLCEPRPPHDPDSPLRFSMEGFTPLQPPSSLLPNVWAAGWNSVQAVNKFQQEVGGPLHRTSPSPRLIASSVQGHLPYFMDVPRPFCPRDDQWLFLPLYQIFSSEELSAQSSPIQERTGSPLLLLRTDEMEELGIKEGDHIDMTVAGLHCRLPVQSQADFPKRTVGCSMVSPCRGLSLPAWGHIQTG